MGGFKPDFSNIGKRDIRQTNLGKLGDEGDVGGHAKACSLGGTCDRFNLFPQGKVVVAIRDPAYGRQYFTPIEEFKQKFSRQAIFTGEVK